MKKTREYYDINSMYPSCFNENKIVYRDTDGVVLSNGEKIENSSLYGISKCNKELIRKPKDKNSATFTIMFGERSAGRKFYDELRRKQCQKKK